MLCSGHGTVLQTDSADYVRDLIVPCTECGGSGKLGEQKCSMCDSRGVISAETAESLGDMDLEFQGVAKAGRYLVLLGAGFAVAVAGILWKIL
jgi:hypothetical protein